MRTVVVSDLHLGVRAGNDIARRPAARGRLLETVRGADRLVLLGDVFELRERPLEDIVALSRPLLADLGEAVGDGEIIVVPGNHDHALVAPIAASLGGAEHMWSLEHRLAPPRTGALGSLGRALGPARLELAYPGVWLDDRIYATHGHYLDIHSPTPMVEVLALAVSARLKGGRPPPGAVPADYERIATPVYRASLRIGRAGQTLGRAGSGDISVRVYERLAGNAASGDANRPGTPSAGRKRIDPGDSRPTTRESSSDLGDRLLRAAIPVAITVLNRLGLGPFDPELSGRALRRANLGAMAEVVARLAIDADHVIFGHTHRAGPLPGDVEGWTVPARGGRPGTRLLNTGSWVYTPAFLGAGPHDSPYWPGRCAVLEDGGDPQLLHPLADAGHAELAPTA